jgi:23S rRNA (cytidine1920-2'-O)/16S rRNA (cytidine1409-2'-O)-methyltransferase
MSLPNVSKEKLRLDELLVRRGFFVSRSRSRDAIARGAVTVAGKVITKPGQVTPDDAEVVVDDPARLYVSRAALKLIAGLDAFKLDPKGATALDIGASTGGFTQVLLERGATHVYAADVGHGQIDEALAGDERVTNLEKLNARELCAEHLGGVVPDFVVSDVSFISLKLALPPALTLARPGAHCVLLVKPQFEAGRAAIGKGGILKDPSMGPQIADDLAAWLETQSGWRSLGIAPSPIEGGDGNNEFLLGGVKDK